MSIGESTCGPRTPAGSKQKVEIHDLGVYEPTTGEIRHNTADEIACWFIDSDYKEESFFVRHAYFKCADELVKKLQRALPYSARRRAQSDRRLRLGAR